MPIEKLKAGKSPGPDWITAEMLRRRRGVDCAAQDNLVQILCRVWDDEELPQSWKDATVVPVYKKKNRRGCSNYRGVSLLSVVGKLLLTIIRFRIKDHLEERTTEPQAGFRSGRGCVYQIFCLRQVFERRIRSGLKLLRFLSTSRLPSTVCTASPCGRRCWWTEYRRKSSKSCAMLILLQFFDTVDWMTGKPTLQQSFRHPPDFISFSFSSLSSLSALFWFFNYSM